MKAGGAGNVGQAREYRVLCARARLEPEGSGAQEKADAGRNNLKLSTISFQSWEVKRLQQEEELEKRSGEALVILRCAGGELSGRR